MQLKKFMSTNENIIDRLNELHKACCDFDGILHPFYACDDEICSQPGPIAYIYGEMCAALTVYYINETECEIYAVTHPDFRRRGYFSALFSEFIKDAEHINLKNVSLPVGHNNSIANHIIRSDKRISFSHTEYVLQYDSPRSAQENPSAFINVTAENNDIISFKFLYGRTVVGGCKTDLSSGCATIFGYEIFEQFRGAGYGGMFIPLVTDYILKREKKILLQVSGANTPAFKMYMHHGFKIYSSVDILVYRTGL